MHYWSSNLPRLERVKTTVDPDDVFHNPQSVRPAGSSAMIDRVSSEDKTPARKLV